MPEINFGKAKPRPVAVPAALAPAEAGRNLLPGTIPVGTVNEVHVDPSQLLPEELADLQLAGIDPAGPIPLNLPDVLQRARAAAEQDMQNPKLALPPNTPPLDVPLQQIGNLDPTQQNQIRKNIQEILAAASTVSPLASVPVDDNLLQIENDLDLTQLNSTQRASQTPAVTQSATQAEPVKAVAPGAMAHVQRDDGTVPGLKHCPHCKWDLSQASDIEVSGYDKQAYVIATCGGIPFRKNYSLFGGKASVEFRGSIFGELDDCYRQASKDMLSAGATVAYEDFVDRFKLYRLVSQLARLDLAGNIMNFPASLAEWELDDAPKDKTRIQNILAMVSTEALKSHTVLRVLIKLNDRFNGLLRKVEDMAEQEDFWIPTED